MIVQASKLTSKPEPHNYYAVLGDDVVVPETIASEYYDIMNGLGVEISLGKSIQSNRFIEFAKKIVCTTSGEDYSIIGPGLITQAIRIRVAKYDLLLATIKRGLLTIPEAFNRMVIMNPAKEPLSPQGLFALMGPTGLV